MSKPDVEHQCPKCFSTNCSNERRPNGDSTCLDCKHKGPSSTWFQQRTVQAKVKDLIEAFNKTHIKPANTILMDSGAYEYWYLTKEIEVPKGFRVLVTARMGRSEWSVQHVEKEFVYEG